MKLIRKTLRTKKKKKTFLRSLIRAGVSTRLFVSEEIALLGGVMMGLEEKRLPQLRF